MLVGAVERLIALRFFVPADADREDVDVGGAFQGCEIEFETFVFALLVLEAPPGDGREEREAKETLLVFEVFVTT